jgi:hypothetical protein
MWLAFDLLWRLGKAQSSKGLSFCDPLWLVVSRCDLLCLLLDLALFAPFVGPCDCVPVYHFGMVYNREEIGLSHKTKIPSRGGDGPGVGGETGQV